MRSTPLPAHESSCSRSRSLSGSSLPCALSSPSSPTPPSTAVGASRATSPPVRSTHTHAPRNGLLTRTQKRRVGLCRPDVDARSGSSRQQPGARQARHRARQRRDASLRQQGRRTAHALPSRFPSGAYASKDPLGAAARPTVPPPHTWAPAHARRTHSFGTSGRRSCVSTATATGALPSTCAATTTRTSPPASPRTTWTSSRTMCAPW